MPIWKMCLKGYSDYNYIINGLTNGFSCGFDKEKLWNEELISGESQHIPLEPVQRKALDEWILKGVRKKYISGPYDKTHKFSFGKLMLAPLFVVPKPNNKWRAIVHMSFRLRPYMYTINELLHTYMKTVQYVRFKEVVKLVKNAGKGAWLFLIDAQDAYYRVPIQPADWKYMGIEWGGKYWVFRSLQMGCSSSPRIYTAFADAVEYVCVRKNSDISFLNGIQQLRHYIDDFFGALPKKADATRLYHALFTVFEILGIPTKWEKCTSPRQRAKILGWIYDTLLQMVLLPEDKRKLLIQMIRDILRTRVGTVKLLQQLIGRLQHASQVIFPGKAFVRRLEALLYLPRHKDNQSFPIGKFVKWDLEWWLKVLTRDAPCGMSFDLLLKHPSDADIIIYTDACTEIGGGGFIRGLGKTIAFQVVWNEVSLKWRKFDIVVLELLMSVAAVMLILPQVHDKAITIYNDNPGAAAALYSKAPPLGRLDLQELVRHLATLAYDNKFYWWGIHETVKVSANMKIADNLSRFQPVKWPENETVEFRDIDKICTELFSILWEAPQNLTWEKDLSTRIRNLFGLSLNPPMNSTDKPSTTEHNILLKGL